MKLYGKFHQTAAAKLKDEVHQDDELVAASGSDEYMESAI